MTASKKPDLTNRNLPLAENHSEIESTLIKDALGEIDPSSDGAAEFFNAGLPKNSKTRVSRQTVWNWVYGVYRVQESRLRTWKALSTDDPRHQLAEDIFALREQEAAFEEHWVGSSNALGDPSLRSERKKKAEA